MSLLDETIMRSVLNRALGGPLNWRAGTTIQDVARLLNAWRAWRASANL